ncbi:MAG: type toxin-antitoxin system VapC family toxin, partial [Glaciihabitans sp.]|nr:type toxin-antitoxin system VapC family toxin [Glaciihabitans sp.]
RAAAWRIAEELGWDDTTNAEYVAVAQLQADAFVTLDEQLAREVEGIVATAPFEALLRA